MLNIDSADISNNQQDMLKEIYLKNSDASQASQVRQNGGRVLALNFSNSLSFDANGS